MLDTLYILIEKNEHRVKQIIQDYKCDRMVEITELAAIEIKNLLKKDNKNPKIDGCWFKVGDKVIQTKNQYDLDIINGDIGYVLDIDKKHRNITVGFENPDRVVELPLFQNDLELAYAITCHKFQGSEARIIVIPIHRAFGPLIMQRNWIYTAVSRAREVCVLVGQREEIPLIIRRNYQQRRFTQLAEMLQCNLPR